MASDLIERLKKCALGSADEDVMVRWDKIRAILKQDKGGTWPRDCFESIIDGYAEDCEDAVKEIASLRTALAIERERAEKAESALSAFDKERQTPEGWKLVPIEPTEAMIDAGVTAEFGGTMGSRVDLCYRAMLSAAPGTAP